MEGQRGYARGRGGSGARGNVSTETKMTSKLLIFRAGLPVIDRAELVRARYGIDPSAL